MLDRLHQIVTADVVVVDATLPLPPVVTYHIGQRRARQQHYIVIHASSITRAGRVFVDAIRRDEGMKDLIVEYSVNPEDCTTGYCAYPDHLPPSGDERDRFAEALKTVLRRNANTFFLSHSAEALVREKIFTAQRVGKNSKEHALISLQEAQEEVVQPGRDVPSSLRLMEVLADAYNSLGEAGWTELIHFCERVVSLHENDRTTSMGLPWNEVTTPVQLVLAQQEMAYAYVQRNQEGDRKRGCMILEEVCGYLSDAGGSRLDLSGLPEDHGGRKGLKLAEVCGKLGSIYKQLYREALRAGDSKRARLYLLKAKERYRLGFQSEPENISCGINYTVLIFTESRSDLFDRTYKMRCNEQLHEVKSILALTLGWVNKGKGAWESDNFDYLARSIQLAVLAEEWPVATMLMARAYEAEHSKWEGESTHAQLRLLMNMHDTVARRGTMQPSETGSFQRRIFEWWMDFYESDFKFVPTPDLDTTYYVLFEISGIQRPHTIYIEVDSCTICIQDVQSAAVAEGEALRSSKPNSPKLEGSAEGEERGRKSPRPGSDVQPVSHVMQMQIDLQRDKKLRMAVLSEAYSDQLNISFVNRELKDQFNKQVSALKHKSDPEGLLNVSQGGVEEELNVEVHYDQTLGSGATATVYLGTNHDTGEHCAVKAFVVADEANQEFIAMEAEINLMKKFVHSNIVRFYGCLRVERRLLVYMERISGGSLQQYYEKHGAGLPEGLTRSFTRHVLSALHYLHTAKAPGWSPGEEEGFLHRDIKCANVLVDEARLVAKLSDFGCSSALDDGTVTEREGETAEAAGTAMFLAPEVLRKPPQWTRAGDVWSLGCMVLEMTKGTWPWDPEEFGRCSRMIESGNRKPAWPQACSPGLQSFFTACFEFNPAKRPTCAQLLDHSFLMESQVSMAHFPTNISPSMIRESTVLRATLSGLGTTPPPPPSAGRGGR